MMKLSFRDQCFITGSIGDLLLQSIVKMGWNIANLKGYFDLHRPFESMFIAGGMMYFLGYIYELLPIEQSYFNLFMYGGLADVIWRQFSLFGTLTNTYYKANNQIESFIWGGIPMILPKLLYSLQLRSPT